MTQPPVAAQPGARPPTRVVSRRVVAAVIDWLVVNAISAASFWALADQVAAPPQGSVRASVNLNDTYWAITGGSAALYFAIVLGVALADWVILPGRYGWSLGKLATGIRVVDAEGRMPAGIGRNLLRQVMWIVDDFPYLIPALTGFVVALASDGNRRVGDMAAGTYVVRREAAEAGSSPTAAPPGRGSAGDAFGVPGS